jgi:uncharacterized protein YecE (DUF72 family)
VSQLDLFARELDFEAERALASKLPGHLRLGTSSWTFPGWSGIVYPRGTSERELALRGLELYVRHPLLTTVGIDRSYYAPLDAPTLSDYARQLPPGFRCVMKVWSELSAAVHPSTRRKNPSFLDAGRFQSEVLAPIAQAFAAHAGPLVFEIMPLHRSELPEPGELARRLDGFFARLPRDFRYAVELRNRELLTADYLEVLARHGVAHVLSFWERMPDIGEQLALPGVLSAPFVVARVLIPPGRRYEARKRELAPFDRIVDPQPKLRDDVARLCEACEALGKQLFAIVNNKAEGSSPLTLRAIAERIAARRDRC